MLAAKAQNLAFHRHNLDAEQIIGRQTVFQAMDPTRILGNIATNRTGDLTGRVRRIIEPVSLNGMGDCQIGNTGLGHHTAVVIVDFVNAVEFAKPQQHRIGQLQRPARKRCAGPARHQLDLVLVAPLHHSGNLFNCFGQHDSQRQLTIGRQSVGIKSPHALGRINYACCRHKFAQCTADFITPVNGMLVWFGHQHLLSPQACCPGPRY